MKTANYPSSDPAYRKADQIVHLVGLILILVAGGSLILRSVEDLAPAMVAAVTIYVFCALASNLASIAYHFSPWHEHRTLLRRIDHAAIYPSISGTFTPFFVQAGTSWTMTLFFVCWALTFFAIWKKTTSKVVKSKWSTASYLGLGAIGLSALPDLQNVPPETVWFILGGAVCYVIGTMFYARKSMPYRYAIWHLFVNLGAISMFVGIWLALFR